MGRLKLTLESDEIIRAQNETISMSQAAKLLNVSFATFKRRSIELGLYKPNQGRPGFSRSKAGESKSKVLLADILEGKHPQYGSSKLKRRLFDEGVKQKICEECGITNWMNRELTFHLDHVDGNPFNNGLLNLRILCPNCHSQHQHIAEVTHNCPVGEMVDTGDFCR